MERTAECHCGQLRAIASGEPDSVYVCHCKACQRRTGAIIHNGSRWLKSQVRIEGEHKTYGRVADSGFEIRFHFLQIAAAASSGRVIAARLPTASLSAALPTEIFRHRPRPAGKSRCTAGSDCRRAPRISRKLAPETASMGVLDAYALTCVASIRKGAGCLLDPRRRRAWRVLRRHAAQRRRRRRLSRASWAGGSARCSRARRQKPGGRLCNFDKNATRWRDRWRRPASPRPSPPQWSPPPAPTNR